MSKLLIYPQELNSFSARRSVKESPEQSSDFQEIKERQEFEEQDRLQQILISPPNTTFKQQSNQTLKKIQQHTKSFQFENQKSICKQIQKKNQENEKKPTHDKQQSLQLKNMSSLNKSWKNGSLRIIYYISRFIMQLKTHASKMKHKFLTKKMLQLINDQGSCEDQIIYQKTMANKRDKKMALLKISINLMNEKFQKLLNSIPDIEPDSIFKLVWDFILLILILLNIFYVPMKISFHFDSSELIFTTIPLWIFFIDIFFQFNTAYYKNGQIFRSKQDIFNNYISSNFWFDIIIIFPFIITQFDFPYMDFLMLLRASKTKKLLENIEDFLNLQDNIQAILDLVKSVSFIIYVAHLSACAWHFIGEIQITSYNANSWLIDQNIYHLSWVTKYIYSIYFCTITTVTVGYGDITPVTNSEKIFVVCLTLIICGVFGYTISSIGEIFKSLMEKEQIFQQKMKFLKYYLKKKNVSQQLQLQVRKYFEYYFRLESEKDEDADVLLGHLTKNLKERVQIDLYFTVLKKSKLIRETLDDNEIKKLCTFVKEQKYAPELEIFKVGETANRLIFLQSGSINIYAEQQCENSNQQKIISLKQIKTQTVIGESEFVTNRSYSYSGCSENFTQIVYLNFEDFISIIKSSQESLEKYSMLKDNILFNDHFKNYGSICEICKWTHSFSTCPFVFFQVNQNKIQNEFKKNHPNNRQVFSSRSQNKSASFPQLQDTQETALAYILENKIVDEGQLTDEYLQGLGFKLEEQKEGQDQQVYDGHFQSTPVSQEQSNISLETIAVNENESNEIPNINNFHTVFQNIEEYIKDSEHVQNQTNKKQFCQNQPPTPKSGVLKNSGRNYEVQNSNLTSQSRSQKFQRAVNINNNTKLSNRSPVILQKSTPQIQDVNSSQDVLKKVRFKGSHQELSIVFQNSLEKQEKGESNLNLIGSRKKISLLSNQLSKIESKRQLQQNHNMKKFLYESLQRSFSKDQQQNSNSHNVTKDLCSSVQDNREKSNENMTYKSQTQLTQKQYSTMGFETEIDLGNDIPRIDFDIDKMKIMLIYFPLFNFNNVINKIEEIVEAPMFLKKKSIKPLNKYNTRSRFLKSFQY